MVKVNSNKKLVNVEKQEISDRRNSKINKKRMKNLFFQQLRDKFAKKANRTKATRAKWTRPPTSQ